MTEASVLKNIDLSIRTYFEQYNYLNYIKGKNISIFFHFYSPFLVQVQETEVNDHLTGCFPF